MKQRLSFGAIVLVGACVLFAYGSAAAQTPKPGVSAKTEVKGDPRAVKGGTLRAIRGMFPVVLGYAPEFGPADSVFALPYVERLVDWDEKGNIIPQLAESWQGDPKNKMLTFHLRKGVKFHDGTSFDADAVKWNLELTKAAGRLTDGEFVKSIDVIDEYTVRLLLTEYTSLSLMNYGWSPMFSPTAFKNNGGKEWARTHAVGTGPFKLASFKRDTSIRYERNENYWRKGYPLLDAIEIRFVPDPATSVMMMQAREADSWLEALMMKDALALEKKGFGVNWGPGMFWALLPNSSNPKSPLSNKKVREAIECAIDRPTLAKTLGLGKFEALSQIVPAASPAFVRGYDPRPYDPEKAKRLLAEAGSPNGFETKILALEFSRDEATAVQSYLTAVGIKAEVDLADLGRYFAAIFGPGGWTDLALAQSGINPDGTDLFVHWGPRPMTYRFGQIQKSPEFLALCEKALKTYDQPALKKAMQQAVKQAGDDAMVVPLFRSAQAHVMQPYVHSDYMKIHTITWDVSKDWKEKSK
jgi:peptide/nickel transport system substrate-binding protein